MTLLNPSFAEYAKYFPSVADDLFMWHSLLILALVTRVLYEEHLA